MKGILENKLHQSRPRKNKQHEDRSEEKTDIRETGNNKIMLKPWEKEMKKLLDSCGKKSTILKSPGFLTTIKGVGSTRMPPETSN